MKMRGHSRRLLSVLLALVMLLSLLPTAVLAADPTPGTWKKIAFADITADDTIAITMTKDKTTWVLPNDGTAQKAASAITGTVSGDTLTTTSESQFGWKVIKSTDTFQLVSASDNTKYLYSTDKNNGIRQGKGESRDWKVDATSGYLFNVAQKRYVGVYNQQDWRSYTTLHDNIAGQTLNFWKLDTVPARQSGIVTDLTTLQDGDTVVVFNPANGKTLSTEYNGFYNKGTDVTLTDGKLEGFTAADKWTLGINDDGTYTFATADGKKLAMGAKFTSTPLDEVNQSWKITPAATKDCFYIQNTVRNNYIEWYADKGNWSSYYNIGNNEALFAQQLYLVIDSDQPSAGLPKPGDQVVIYNQNAQAVLAAQNDNAPSPAINKAAATIKDGKAACANGAAVFTVEKSGDYYRFYNKTYGYLCAGGTGNNAFYSATASDDADWLLRTCSGGASIYAVDANGNPASTLPSTVSPVVYGHATTYSIDVDKDGKGGAGTPKYTYAENDNRLLVMATEQLAGKGLIVVSGAAFMSNFEVQAQLDNGAEKNYSNYRICENLVSYLNPVQLSTIDQIHQQPEEGFKYTVEGIVTSNASGHDKDTAFFDCIYIQDETGGINCFPVAGNFKIGDRVRVSGTTSSYQGERQLAVTKIEKIGDGTPVTPLTVTSTQVNDGSVLGRLVTLKGIVTAIEMAEGKVQTILVRDPQGKVARVFIDGYICPESEVQNLKVGCAIEATGLASYDNTFVLSDGTAMAPRIRISNRADVICTDHTHAFGAWTVTTPATCTASGAETRTCACGETETRLLPATGHTDANKDGKCDLCGQTLTPATGDTMHLTLWLSLMALTALAGVALTRQKKRRA